jgi:hypothetical protein
MKESLSGRAEVHRRTWKISKAYVAALRLQTA